MIRIKLAIMDLGEGYHAVKVLEMTGIERDCGKIFVAKGSLQLHSVAFPSFHSDVNLYLWGDDKELDSQPFIVASEHIPAIIDAVKEFNEAHKGDSDSHGWAVVE